MFLYKSFKSYLALVYAVKIVTYDNLKLSILLLRAVALRLLMYSRDADINPHQPMIGAREGEDPHQ